MNYLTNFLIIILQIIMINSSSIEGFNPIPDGNGVLNEKYSHYKNDENNLYFIFLNFRHGARAPLYLKQNNTDMLGGKWPIKGEITNLGRRQQYEIGLKNRKRYSYFISEEYDPKEIKIYSTNYNRSITSAECQLLGLYNNISYFDLNFSDFNNSKNNDIDIDDISSIIPPIKLFEENQNNNNIHINEYKYEKTFRNHFDCPYLKEQFHKNWNKSNKIIDTLIDDFNTEFYDILMKEYKHINKKLKTVKGFDKFCDVYLSVYYDQNHNHILDKIAKHGKNITKIAEICKDYLFNHFIYIRNNGYAKDNAIISQTPILKKILDYMEVRADQNNNFASEYTEPKFVLYSGDDSTLFEIQKILKECFNIEFEYTDFSATQLIELRKYNDIYYIEVYYNDRLKMNITYEEFKNRISNILMKERDIYKICYKKKEEFYLTFKILLMSFVIIILLTSVIILILKINKEKYFNVNNQTIIQMF